jgi:glycosyltransferase involved in cell wall biosynthesis
VRRVAIIQRVLPHYRAPFFRGLYAALATDGIALSVIYGDHRPGTVPETVPMDEPWAIRVENRYLDVLGAELVWQPAWRVARDADLVVIEQANRLVLNYPLLLCRVLRRAPRLAFWGHGRNYQATSPSSLSERWKRALAARVDGWFAYTELSARDLVQQGVPPHRITVVDNAIDTSDLAAAAAAVTDADLARVRDALVIPDDAVVGLFCGGFHAGKELPFLVEACEAIRRAHPTFHAVFVGDGPERACVAAAAERHRWVHHVGAVYGPERAVYFRLASVLLMPAHLGLAIVDSFATGTPVVATERGNHSPEVAYLEHGVNGLVTSFSVDAYARAVVDVLRDPGLRETLRAGCAESARRYTLANMVARFSAGVRACLDGDPGSRRGGSRRISASRRARSRGR